jgi:hypothetical protein
MPQRKRVTAVAVPVDLDEQFDYDLDALVVEDEDAPPFRFKWGGRVFEMALLATLDVQVQTDLEGASIEEQLRLVIGDEAYSELITIKGAGGRVMSTGRMRDLVKAWMAHQGLEPGKSPDSSRSSASMVRRSRPTSRSARRR